MVGSSRTARAYAASAPARHPTFLGAASARTPRPVGRQLGGLPAARPRRCPPPCSRYRPAGGDAQVDVGRRQLDRAVDRAGRLGALLGREVRAGQRDQRPRLVAVTAGGRGRGERRDGVVDVALPTLDGAERQRRRAEAGPQRQRRAVRALGVGQLAGARPRDAEVQLDPRIPRVEGRGPLERGAGAGGVARRQQPEAQLGVQRDRVRVAQQRLAVGGDGLGHLAAPGRGVERRRPARSWRNRRHPRRRRHRRRHRRPSR
jgi:hypothetical protein